MEDVKDFAYLLDLINDTKDIYRGVNKKEDAYGKYLEFNGYKKHGGQYNLGDGFEEKTQYKIHLKARRKGSNNNLRAHYKDGTKSGGRSLRPTTKAEPNIKTLVTDIGKTVDKISWTGGNSDVYMYNLSIFRLDDEVEVYANPKDLYFTIESESDNDDNDSDEDLSEYIKRDEVEKLIQKKIDEIEKNVGKDGKDGVDGEDGKDGKDGNTPYIKDKNWWIGDEDTGVKAKGEDGTGDLSGTKGEPGKDGKDGKDGKQGAKGEPGKDGKDGKNASGGGSGDNLQKITA